MPEARELDGLSMYRVRFFGYKISDGHMRWILDHLEANGLDAQDVADAYDGFSISEAMELLDLDLFEFYAALLYFRVRIPTAQRAFASRRLSSRSKRSFNEDGTVKGTEETDG